MCLLLKCFDSYILISFSVGVICMQISTKKSDLDNILKYFNIFVDTPTSILTQEESKRLIHGSAKEKYQFFLKATGLRAMKDDMERIQALVAETHALLHTGVEEVNKKKQVYQEAKERLARYNALSYIESQMRECTAMMFWDEVRTAEGVVADVERQAADKQELVEKAQEKLEQETKKGSNTEQQLAELGEEQRERELEEAPILQTLAVVQTEINALNKKYNLARAAVTELTNNKNEWLKRLKDATKEVGE